MPAMITNQYDYKAPKMIEIKKTDNTIMIIH